MRVKNGSDVAQRVTGDRRDLRFGTSDKRQSRNRGAAQIIERHTDDAGCRLGLTPRSAESVLRPWCPVTVDQDERATFCRTVERSSERRAYFEAHARTGL